MDLTEKQERKRDAWRRLRAQRQRAGQLRGRVVAISLIAFVLLWGIVFVQMATGNDPVLGDSSSTVAAPQRGGTAPRKPSKAKEVVEPEPVEVEAVEPEPAPVEVEVVEPEPEPAPVTTSQS